MSSSPFITLLRSLNYTSIVHGLADNLVDTYDGMKLPKMETKIKSISESFDKQTEQAKYIGEFNKENSLAELTEIMKDINKFCEEKFQNRKFKIEPTV